MVRYGNRTCKLSNIWRIAKIRVPLAGPYRRTFPDYGDIGSETIV